VSTRAVVPFRAQPRPGLVRRLLPGPVRELVERVEHRTARLPTRLNEYGYDPFGLDPHYGRQLILSMCLVYRFWLRVETHGIEKVPEGRVLLIANHAGNTFAWDGAMLSMAMLLEAEPPRLVRGMAEYYLPTIPFFSVLMHRMGSVVGTPTNCAHLLEHGEAVMVFPEGQRGFVKPWRRRYQLQTFGLGFLRLALETDTPIVPVGIVGGEEQSPGIANVRPLGRLIGAPAFPITPTFPWLGPLGLLPYPVRYRIVYGEPLALHEQAPREAADDRPRMEEMAARVRLTVQHLVDRNR